MRPAFSSEASTPAVLVVEDEIIILVAAADTLRERGYRVLESRTGEQAQDLMRSGEPIQVMFSDINLGPGIDGFELAKWTRQFYPDVRIILTSGVVRPTRLVADISDAPFLVKPYSYEEVAHHVERLSMPN